MLSRCPIREVAYPVDEARRRGTVRDVEKALRSSARPRRLTVDRLNRALIGAFREPSIRMCRTHAWPIPGGVDQWTREVAHRLAQLGDEAITEMLRAG